MIAPGGYAASVRTGALATLMSATLAWACFGGRAATPQESECMTAPPSKASLLAAATPSVSDRARDALVPTCGSCHRSDLPTAKPGALAVFDLTKDPWWVTIKDEQYDGVLRRVRGSSAIAEDDKVAVETFVAAIRSQPPPTREP